MGAETFYEVHDGATAQKAFNKGVEEARYEYGHGGYTGTIAEKDDFTVIPLPEGWTAEDYADALEDKGDDRICDKWGPAGCLKIEDGKYAFFGWASS